MKKPVSSSPLVFPFIFILLLFLNFSLSAQDTTTVSLSLPDSINAIVSVSCMPCHSDAGGAFSRPKLNFDKWTQYYPDEQKEKASLISAEVNNGGMPPKSTREKSPEKIPTKEQAVVIKNWSEALNK